VDIVIARILVLVPIDQIYIYSPSVIIPVITNDDTVTFSKIYFIYVGVPVGLLLLCLLGYILDIRKKNKGLKKMNALSSFQTTNVARVPLNKIPPFAGV
jgi:hypothetical protein